MTKSEKDRAAEATEWLRNTLQGCREKIAEIMETSEPEFEAWLYEATFEDRLGEGSHGFRGLEALALVHDAACSPGAFLFVRRMLARDLRKDRLPATEFKDLLIDIVEGKAMPISKQGSTSRDQRMNEVLSLFIKLIRINFDLPRFANPASRKGHSAIEIVHAQRAEFHESFRKVTVESMEKAFQRGEKRRGTLAPNLLKRRTK